MNVKERFDRIIDQIDENIKAGRGIGANEIANSVLDACDENNQLLTVSAAFQFLTGKALIPYIEDRQMSLACDALLNGSSVDKAFAMTGYTDPFTFAIAFEKLFDVRPENISELELEEDPAASWDVCATRELEEGEIVPQDHAIEEALAQHSDFLDSIADDLGFDLDIDFGMDMPQPEPEDEGLGIPDEDVALRLEFGFSPVEADAAVMISEKKNMDLPTAYVMAFQLTQQFRMADGAENMEMDNLLYVYAKYGIAVPEAVSLVRSMMDAEVGRAYEEPEDLVKEVLKTGKTYTEGKEIYNAYITNRVDTTFEIFMAKVIELGDISQAVEAFYDPYSQNMLNDFFNMMRINFEDMSFYEQSEAAMAQMELEAKESGFTYDDSADTDLSDLDLGNIGLGDLDF